MGVTLIWFFVDIEAFGKSASGKKCIDYAQICNNNLRTDTKKLSFLADGKWFFIDILYRKFVSGKNKEFTLKIKW